MTNCYYIRASSSVDDLNAYGGSNDTNFAITNFMSSIGWSDDIAFGTIAQEALGSNNTELFNIQWGKIILVQIGLLVVQILI